MTMMTPPPLDQEDEEMLVPHSDFATEGPQPMEVAPQTEAASTVENQPVEDPPSSRFTWTIENFSRLNTKKHYSDVFFVGGYKWRVLIFPKGNNVDHLSMYLDVADSASLPYGWSRYAQFSLGVINQIHNKYTVRKDRRFVADSVSTIGFCAQRLPNVAQLADDGSMGHCLLVPASTLSEGGCDSGEGICVTTIIN